MIYRARCRPSVVLLDARAVPEPVHILDAVADIISVLPHAEERKILNGASLHYRFLLGGNVHLDDRSLFDLDGFERPENAIFVLGRNSHGCGESETRPL